MQIVDLQDSSVAATTEEERALAQVATLRMLWPQLGDYISVIATEALEPGWILSWVDAPSTVRRLGRGDDIAGVAVEKCERGDRTFMATSIDGDRLDTHSPLSTARG